MTRWNVIVIGSLALALGGVFYGGFRLTGMEGISSGIAAEALLVLLIIFWILTYLFRVVTGNMTFMEQRRRYRKSYEDLATADLQSKFEAMTQEEQIRLLEQIEKDSESNKSGHNVLP